MAKVPERADGAIYRLFGSEVLEKIKDDPRSINNLYFGFGSSDIFDVLQFGRADFRRAGYRFPDQRTITSDELVLCYCNFMMKGHLFAARENFAYRHNWLSGHISRADNVVFIDVGCGPGTAGLAFADIFPNTDFVYYGVDNAKAMRTKCKSMLEAAQTDRLITDDTIIDCESSWTQVPTTFASNSLIILNFSYFFASSSLTDADIDSLVEFYEELIAKNPSGRVLVSYTNSVDARAETNYRKFIAKVDIVYDEQPPLRKNVEYYTKIRADDTKWTKEFSHENFEKFD